MKIQIVYEEKEAIEGFEVINIKYGLDSLKGIIDHSSEEIYISESLDKLDLENANLVLSTALKKLRLDGKIFISGTSLRSVCLNVIGNEINYESFSKLIAQSSSLRDVNDIEEILINQNISIETSTVRGNIYEITATRKRT